MQCFEEGGANVTPVCTNWFRENISLIYHHGDVVPVITRVITLWSLYVLNKSDVCIVLSSRGADEQFDPMFAIFMLS